MKTIKVNVSDKPNPRFQPPKGVSLRKLLTLTTPEGDKTIVLFDETSIALALSEIVCRNKIVGIGSKQEWENWADYHSASSSFCAAQLWLKADEFAEVSREIADRLAGGETEFEIEHP
jgi:hypothetical protein